MDSACTPARVCFGDRIVIPIHTAAGALIAYAGRAVDRQEPKYRFPAGFRESLVIFNPHRAIATPSRTVIVVEGLFGAIAVHQAGFPVVAPMGFTVSRHQADLLSAHCGRVVLMPDGDEPGRQGAVSVAQALDGRLSISAIAMRWATGFNRIT